MKLLCALFMTLSFNVMAQKTEKFYVPNGEMEQLITRNAAETRKQTAMFSWDEVVTGTEQYCVQWDFRRRYNWCRDRRGRLFRCGVRDFGYCIRYEARQHTRNITQRYRVRLKFDKSARLGFKGAEKYLVKFDKASKCGFVTSANANADKRIINNKTCRKVIIK